MFRAARGICPKKRKTASARLWYFVRMPIGLSLLFYVAGFTLRPYVPPALEPEPVPNPPSVAIVEVDPTDGAWDANVYARPVYSAPLVGNVARGARVRVRGELRLESTPYCDSSMYYALDPFGWICSADTRPTSLPPTTRSVLELVDDTPLPYRYVMVVVEEGEYLPMWGSLDDLRAYNEPERQLGRGDTLALDPTQGAVTYQFEDQTYYVTVDGKVVPATGTFTLKNYSEWQGVPLSAADHVPFGWVTPRKAPVYDAPKGNKVDTLERRARVDILGEEGEGRGRWLRIGEGRYVKADHLNEVRKLERPEGTGTHAQWIDVDLGEQVVVAYQNEQPVYATLTSSGRPPNNTPRGNYPVWGKASAITMKSQEYDDHPYYVNRVPWVMFFQAHNALHGAYWHDRFGSVKSHGCANLSPRDARYLFDWLAPALPPGWTAVRYWDLNEAPVVHVRNSRRLKAFAQERNVGPPNKEDESARLEAAVARREAEAQAEAERLAAEQFAESPAPLLPGVETSQSNAPAPLLPPAPLR
jgi:hypothetical protein